MGRSAADVFRDHLLAVNSGDMQTILTDYADHAQMLTAQGALNGRAGVEAFYTQAFSLLPGAPRLPSSTPLREKTLCLCGGLRSHRLDTLTMVSTLLCSRTA